ncbi:putative uncharacterized protein DDB_G0286901 [Vespa crabro]|uniref:putative uncharacterized protein DDB_G0286901 n=1 Tax=Vespa crabro TaxID=7445 RepID=UPI001F0176F9|nr:putative uncharacterized protein DDB_G0286901 [Vespa crabro]
MYALQLSVVGILVVFGSVKCSVSSILDVINQRDTTTPCKATRECLNCKQSRLCMLNNNGILEQVAIINCTSNSNSATPYCDKDTGLCSSVASNQCLSNEFICPFVDGIYPDPNNCRRYHLCAKGYRTTNICPPNNVYDTRLQNCKLSYYSFDCTTVNCRGKEGQFFAYPTDDRIYGSCVEERPYLIGRCKDYEKFDVNLNRCVRVCRKLENQYTNDCQKYIRCAEVRRGQYQPVLQYCACDQGFDKIKGICTTTAECLEGNNTCETTALLSYLLGLSDDYNEDDDSVEEEEENEQDPQVSDLIINNSDNKNSNNNISNGDDNANGNIVNGNSNQNNSNSGDINNIKRPALRQFIINNSGNSHGSNKVTNGNDEENGNIVNGNGNSNNKNEGDIGNVEAHRPGLRPLIINNSENSHSDNDVSNGNDSDNGNIVNGNGNSNNKNEGDIGNVKVNRPGLRPLIINNSGNSHSDNDVSNGNDNDNGNIVNGNGNSNNKNEGDIGNVKANKPGLRSLIINNSENSHSDNDVSNGNDSDNGNIVNGNGNSNNKNEGDISNVKVNRPGLRPLIINNSGNSHSDNDVSNGNDSDNGNIVNGNGNSNNKNEGDIGNVKVNRPGLRPLIINNSGNSHSDNDVSNGNDSDNGNIVNGNGNSNNKNEGDIGNVKVNRPGLRPLIINNSGNSHSDNDVSNGNDNDNGNIVNGNGNSNNKNEGDIGNVKVNRPGLRPLIINNSGNSHSDNDVSNGNDSDNGNIVNGNGNSDNKNEGDVGNIEAHRPGLRPLIISNSGDNHSDNDVSNGNDNDNGNIVNGNGNIVNGNGNSNNKNEGDIGNVKANKPGLRSLIINNSENSHSDNDISNGSDSKNGNIINGNGNANNTNEGNISNRN